MKKIILSILFCAVCCIEANATQIKTVILNNKPLHSFNKEIEPFRQYFTVRGKIANAILKTKVSVDGVDGIVDNKTADLYIALNFTDGHIAKYTENIDLSNVKMKNGKIINFVEILNTLGKKNKFYGFVSCYKPSVLSYVAIDYICENNSNCSIDLK